MELELTMFNTTAIAVLILFLGSYIKGKIEILYTDGIYNKNFFNKI